MSAILAGKRALVVGASSGIGREVGLRLADHGALVAFHGRRRGRLEECVTRAGRGVAVVADMSDPIACEAMVDEAARALGGLDLVVHCASASRLGELRDLDAAEWARLFALNTIAPALVIKGALRHLSSTGVLAFMSSESVGMPFPGLLPYSCSKAALEELIRGARVEHPEVRFTCIRVGVTQPTEFARDIDEARASELFPRWLALGRVALNAMDVVEVGRLVADPLALAVTNPSVDLHDMVLRPPGLAMTPDMLADMQAAVLEAKAAVSASGTGES